MSHVSQKSVDQVDELIRLVKPDVVAVELCKERLGLMLDPVQAATPPKVWHSRKILIEGIPEDGEPWPSQEQLRSLLTCVPGRPVTQPEIEADVVRLLATGLFGSCKPGASSAGRDEAPSFLARPTTSGSGSDVDLSLVAPLGALRFRVTPRSLPSVTAMEARVDSSLRSAHVDQAELDAICLKATDECKGGAPGMAVLLRTRQRVIEAVAARGAQAVVSFIGVDTGRVEMLVKASKASDPPYLSGLEPTAANGEGFGIEPFRPQRNSVQIGKKMFIPAETVDALRAKALGAAAAAAAEGAAGAAAAGAAGEAGMPHARVKVPLRDWTREEMEAKKPEPPARLPLRDELAALMSTAYARVQSKAGRTLGVEPGQAWRTALEAATAVGSGAVLLCDRPTDVTDQRMAAGLGADAGVRLISALAIIIGTAIFNASTSILPDGGEAGALAAAFAAAAAVAAPVVGPFIEVSRFAGMTAEQIEDAVAIKEAIDQGDMSKPLKLYGEDALLDWPGAFPALIEERDEFMARALAAVATGQPGVVPAFVLDQVDGRSVWRFGSPAGAPARAAPTGLGDGELGAAAGVRSVVGVIGSAHVRGMIRRWNDAVKGGAKELEPLLEDAQ
ncbi:hypothetical protein HYH03_009599 [Edaphochlamys debaryana]|uniref:Uncharacterized protein n=1 Tax=Edaphochlamys debaryana TaxID=47281 RepID=A0A835XXN2_9CHLO|nr:hypothetical protein HYH03_009599 [Edaphochlamys debaryana]|eukprot:KAG2492108.1 hypothetical protein HYH03_009599 [Edaphochlamys debaryana]